MALTVSVLQEPAPSGKGIFRGFIRARITAAAAGQDVGPTVLFFGCQHPEWDDLYADDFAEHTAAGHLEIHRAYSQLPDGEIRYVQHRLWEHHERVRTLIGDGAHVYVCGDATGMGPAVEKTLRRSDGRVLTRRPAKVPIRSEKTQPSPETALTTLSRA